MRQAFLFISAIILLVACTSGRKGWTFEDAIPVMTDGDNKKYWDYLGGSHDTLQAGGVFTAKLYMPRKNYEDSLGNLIDIELQRIDFDITEDSIRLKFRSYSSISNDTAFITIPVDSLINKFSLDNLRWLASLSTSIDTTFMISGDWHLSRDK